MQVKNKFFFFIFCQIFGIFDDYSKWSIYDMCAKIVKYSKKVNMKKKMTELKKLISQDRVVICHKHKYFLLQLFLFQSTVSCIYK